MTKDLQSDNPLFYFDKETLPHIDGLYSLALRLTGNKRIAFNLLKETYVKAFRFYAMLDKSINVRSWMFRIMRNAYLSSYSKKIKTDITEYDVIENLFQEMNDSIDFASVQKEIYDKLNNDEISDLIASLPDNFKMVIVLSDVQGFTYDEIADFVDIPMGVVRSRLHRARKMLFVKLYNYAANKGYIKRIKD